MSYQQQQQQQQLKMERGEEETLQKILFWKKRNFFLFHDEVKIKSFA